MNKFLFYIFPIVLFSIACQTSSNSKLKIASAVYSLSDGENGLARQDYEWNRLKNPETNEIPANMLEREFDFVNSTFNKTHASSFEWQLRGPVNVGGRTRALALDVLNEDRIFAGGVSGGLWLSESGGQNFEKLTTNLMLHSVTSITQDTRAGNENVWYYGTGELSGNSADLVGHGIYKSEDNGLTWELLPSTSNDSAKIVSPQGDFSYVQDVVVNPINGDVVVASFAGIFISQNGGDTWQNVLEADDSPDGFGYLNFGNQTSVIVDSEGVYFASLSSDAADKGIWQSFDGLNWVDVTPSGFSSSYRRIEAAVNPMNNKEVLFLADASINPSTDNHELWFYEYTETNGMVNTSSWENRTSNLPDGDCLGFYTFNFGYYQSQNSYDMLIRYHPTEANVVFIGGTNLYRSEDAFTSNSVDWIGGYQCDVAMPSNYIWPNHHPDNHVLAFLPSNPDVMISAHDGGLSKTNDCLSDNIEWTSLNNGYGTTQFYTVAIEEGNTDNNMIIGGLQDNGTWLTNTLDPNSQWFNTFYGDGAYCAIAEGRENFYVSWQGGKTFKFDINDNGVVEALTRIDPIGGDNYRFINPFILDPNNSNTMYLAAGKYIWKNDSLSDIPLTNNEYDAIDQGWSRLDESITDNLISTNNYISALEMPKANSDVIYYGTWSGFVFKLTGLSTGALVKESIKGSNMPGFGANVSCIETNPSNEDEILVTFSNYEVKSIFHSLDGGNSWIDVGGSLEENPDGSGSGPSVNWAHIYHDETDSVYLIGTTSGLFSTTELAAENTIWTREGEAQIGNVPVTMITSRTFDKNIVIATHGAGIFSTKVIDVGITDLEQPSVDLNVGFAYPNPAKDKLSVDVQLKNNKELKINILDVLGKKVEQESQLNLSKGAHTIKWNVSGYPNGIYFMKFSNGHQTISRKIVVKR